MRRGRRSNGAAGPRKHDGGGRDSHTERAGTPERRAVPLMQDPNIEAWQVSVVSPDNALARALAVRAVSIEAAPREAQNRILRETLQILRPWMATARLAVPDVELHVAAGHAEAAARALLPGGARSRAWQEGATGAAQVRLSLGKGLDEIAANGATVASAVAAALLRALSELAAGGAHRAN